MRIPRIHTRLNLHAGASIDLEPGASAHIARALRMSVGDSLRLFDGAGAEYSAELQAVSKKTVVALVGERLERTVESPLRIHLGIAISRGDRMDWVVQKATELGVTRLSPLFTERTEVKLKGERADRKLQHWRQVAISACEQCGRNVVPEIGELTDLAHWLDGAGEECKLVLHHRAGDSSAGMEAPGSLALLVGPEGGLSAAEIEAAERAGFDALALGPRVLRTETAPLAAIAILQARWGDMSVV